MGALPARPPLLLTWAISTGLAEVTKHFHAILWQYSEPMHVCHNKAACCSLAIRSVTERVQPSSIPLLSELAFCLYSSLTMLDS